MVEYRNEKLRVKKFYDEIGWHKDAQERFVDSAQFEALGPASREYIKKCHLRLKRHLPQSGVFLLDVASGPVQYPEYLAYSEHYDYRVCMDISLEALKHAREKLGKKGLYVLGDITRLPIKPSVIDAVVSLHTIYHVPAAEQKKAFEEIYRVLRTGARGVVVYSWGNRSLLMNLTVLPFRIFIRLLKGILGRLVAVVRRSEKKKASGGAPGLYFFAHSRNWIRREIVPMLKPEILVWRSVSVTFLDYFVHPRLRGGKLMDMIWKLEEKFPRLMGKIGQYPMLIIRK